MTKPDRLEATHYGASRDSPILSDCRVLTLNGLLILRDALIPTLTAGSATSEGPPSLLGITIRRSMVLGRFFLVYGTGISVLLGVVLGLVSGSSFAAAFPLLLPIFASVGSMGGLAVFTSDRLKGTLEYFMAYGFSPRRLFLNFLTATLVLVSIVVSVGLGVGVGLYLARGNAFTPGLAVALGLYAVPMSFASAAFAATMGMYWSALSSPRAGMNSPIGLAPFIGILPPVTTLFIVVALGASGATTSVTTFYAIAVAVMALVVVFVVLLLALINRFLRRERLLSPA